MYYAIVPAAGTGSRMGSDRPKQYLGLAERPVLWHALAALLDCPRIDAVCVVIAQQDEWWGHFDWRDLGPRLRVLPVGGPTRAASVANALGSLGNELGEEDWVLVHDGARPCLARRQLDGLIATLGEDPVGGLLAVPVADTLKRSDNGGRVTGTVPRDNLWQAQTPQMFRYGLLQRALVASPDVTDEASAVEALGLKPRLVAADATNLKITYPQDLALAAQILRARQSNR